jgi:tetratricopeptide (TPR) repeat protein
MKHLLVIALFALPAVALAGPQEKQAAQKHVTRATEAHQAGKYDIALTELEAAYALDPQSDLLYAMGQVQVKLGHCAEAITLYERFVASNPPADAAASANEAITTCKAQLPPPPPPQPEPPPPPPEPAPEPQLPPQPETSRFDRLGAAVIGAGVVSIVAGAVLYSSARNNLDDAERATSYDRHDELVGDARLKRNISVGVGAVGLLAVGFGAWHYATFRSESRVAVSATSTSGVVSWRGRF